MWGQVGSFVCKLCFSFEQIMRHKACDILWHSQVLSMNTHIYMTLKTGRWAHADPYKRNCKTGRIRGCSSVMY